MLKFFLLRVFFLVFQEYYIDEGVWSVAVTRGWPARAGFGHTAVYDELSRRVYVHAGLVSESEATQVWHFIYLTVH